MDKEIFDAALTAGIVGGTLAVLAAFLSFFIEKARNFFGSNLKKNAIENEPLLKERGFRTPSFPSSEEGNTLNDMNDLAKIRNKFERAGVLIEYHETTMKAWKKINTLPKALKLKFLENIDKNQNSDPLTEADRLIAEHEKSQKPFKSKYMNRALAVARARGSDAEKEFLRAANILGEAGDPTEILEKIKTKFPLNSDISPGLYRAERVGMFRVQADGSVTVTSEDGSESTFESFQAFHKAYPFTRIRR